MQCLVVFFIKKKVSSIFIIKKLSIENYFSIIGFLMNHQAALRRTVNNDYAPVLPPPPPVFNIKPAPFDWDKPTHTSSSRNQSLRSSDRPRDYKVIPRTGMVQNFN